MRLLFAALLAVIPFAPLHAADTAPAQVLIVGTWHFNNPGLDIHNVDTDDVLSVKRQREIHAVALGLEAFAPNKVFIESPADTVDAPFAAYRARTLSHEVLRNEAVQLGFRIAMHRELDRVYGIDMPGAFPMDTVGEWAAANGKGEAFGALMQRAGAMVAASTDMLKSQTIGAVLRHINTRAVLAEGQALYLELLRYGAGDQQPGVELNAAWQRRNYLICARLLQSLEPGDRAIVFYGQGHVHALQRCVIEAPGVELVQANDYLPQG